MRKPGPATSTRSSSSPEQPAELARRAARRSRAAARPAPARAASPRWSSSRPGPCARGRSSVGWPAAPPPLPRGGRRAHRGGSSDSGRRRSASVAGPLDRSARIECTARRLEQRLEALERGRACPMRHQHVAGLEHGLRRRLGLETAVGCRARRRSPHSPRTSRDRLPDALARRRDLDLLHPVVGDVDRAADLRVQREPRHLGARGLVRRDHAVGAGAQELLLGVLGRGAGDDRRCRGRSSRAVSVMKMFSASESTQAMIAAGALDPRLREHLVVGGLALDEARRRPRSAASRFSGWGR